LPVPLPGLFDSCRRTNKQVGANHTATTVSASRPEDFHEGEEEAKKVLDFRFSFAYSAGR
jgi:hypothetical protein